jgi:uncharacterized protein involved in type VI secretion and phage assembly
MFYSYIRSEQKMFVRFHQNKCSKSLLISLSKVRLQKRHEAIIKKRRKKEKEKEKEMTRKKEKKDENKDNPCSHKIFPKFK